MEHTYLGPYLTPSGVLCLAKVIVPAVCGRDAALLFWRKERSLGVPIRDEKRVRKERVPLWL